MHPLAPSLAAVLLFAPTFAVAQAAAPATPAPAAAPAGTPPTTPPATPAATPAPEYSSYVALKGGWFGSSGDYQGDSFSGSGAWEIAVGTGRTIGVELSSGSMTTEAGGLEVRTIPLQLALRLAVPIAMVSPFAEVGAGAYFNRVTIGELSLDDVTAGWFAGLGCDVMLGRLLVGAQARYLGIAPTIGAVGELTLDRYQLLLRAGLRF